MCLGSLAVARELQVRRLDHCWAERQLQLFVDHQSTQQSQPNGNVGLGWGISHNGVLVCAKVCRRKTSEIACNMICANKKVFLLTKFLLKVILWIFFLYFWSQKPHIWCQGWNSIWKTSEISRPYNKDGSHKSPKWDRNQRTSVSLSAASSFWNCYTTNTNP